MSGLDIRYDVAKNDLMADIQETRVKVSVLLPVGSVLEGNAKKNIRHSCNV
jgi:hypothetical protein